MLLLEQRPLGLGGETSEAEGQGVEMEWAVSQGTKWKL